MVGISTGEISSSYFSTASFGVFEVPDFSRIDPKNQYNKLPSLNLNRPNTTLINALTYIQNNRLPFGTIVNSQLLEKLRATFPVRPGESFRESAQIGIEFTPFEVLLEKFKRGEIVGWDFNQRLQKFATSSNQLLTFVDKNGNSYYVQVQYDPITKNILPPKYS